MARFYGSAQGDRGDTHRLGHSHIETYAASWSGAVRCWAYGGKDDEPERIRIEFCPWDQLAGQHGSGKTIPLYDGPIAPGDDATAFAHVLLAAHPLRRAVRSAIAANRA
jgi:hypothetical protein